MMMMMMIIDEFLV